jgi:hypothetical protein
LKIQKKESLIEVAGFFAFFSFFVKPQNFIDDFYVGEQHASATVPLQAQTVEDIAGVFACLYAPCKLVPSVSDEFAASEASYGNNHSVFFSPYL